MWPPRGMSANKDAGPTKGVDTERVPAWTLGPKGWLIVRSHINWRGEQVLARTLGSEGGWIVRSHIRWGGERNILYKGVETST